MRNTRKTSLITGISGFIGANLARALIARGDIVHGVVRDSRNLNKIKDILKNVNLHEADVTDASEIKKVVEEVNPNCVFNMIHYGGNSGQNNVDKIRRVIIDGTANLYEACTALPDLKSIVSAGSSSEYGQSDKPMKEDTLPKPNTEYGLAKVWATFYGQYCAREKNLPVVIARLFSVYGPFEHRNRFMTEVILACLKGNEPKLANPKTVRDFVYIADAIEALLVISEFGKVGEIYNVGSGKERTLEEAVSIIVNNTNFKGKLSWGSYEPRSFDTTSWQADTSYTEKQLGWKSKFNLEKGIKETVGWFKDNQDLYENI